jgi:hypothetical protein
MRFLANASFAGAITFQNLLDTYLVGTSATTVADVFQSVRIQSVEAWAVPALGTATSITVEFGGVTAGAVGDQDIHSDTSMGIEPAHIVARPMKRSLASDFQVSSTAVAFLLRCPLGTVVDVTMDFIGQFMASVAAQNASVASTAGFFYMRGLDGVAAAATVLAPELVSATV